MNLMMLLEMASGAMGDRVALGSTADGLTYADLFQRAGAAAARFRSAGVERVSLLDVAGPAVPITLFGAAWAGLPYVPLNYRLTPLELERLAGEVAPSVTIVSPRTAEHVSHVAGVQAVDRDTYLTELADAAPATDEWDMDPEAIAVLLYTSGTTGAPKAAVLRHKHLVSYILGSVEFMGAGEDEATLVSVPPYHIAGTAAMCSAIYAGRRIVQLPNFDADAWIDLARAEAVTHAMVVPTMLARIIERLDARAEGGIETLRALSYGGGKMPRPVIERALELLPDTAFVNAYGLTETSSTIAVLGPEDHREAFGSDDEHVRARLSSVGKPLPTLEVSVRDAFGEEVPAGVSGEIWVRGEQVSGEYLGRESRTRPDGWFPTHDGGSLDADGYLFIEGRIDDIIIRGGENISPGEIEDVLMQHPDIADAAAVGIPDTQWGERIAAVVVPTSGSALTEAEIQAFVKEALRSSRAPDHLVVRNELPYNETGKLLRRVLRDELTELSDTPNP